MGSIVAYVAKRVLSLVITLLLLSLVTFAMVKMIPGDEARVAAGITATPEQVEEMRARLGLDQPWWSQYLLFAANVLRGDFGTSISSHTSIADSLATVLPDTLQLVLVGLVMMVLFTVPAATVSALFGRGRTDTVARAGIIVASGLPTFWLALVVQLLLASSLHVFPISGQFSRGISVPTVTGMSLFDATLTGNGIAIWDALHHLLLPAFVLALPFAAQLYRVQRAEMISVLHSEFMDAARVKGISTWRLTWRHLLPNSSGAAVTVLGATVSMMIGSAVLVESVFGLNGIGAFLTTAVANADRLAVIGGVLVIGVVIVLISFLVDLVQVFRDPRLRAQFGMG